MNAHSPTPAGEFPALVLASTSRYRRELLERLGVAFEVVAPSVDESPHEAETPRALAHRLALEKARAVAALRPDALVIGSDQTATIDGVAVIGKPGDHSSAVRQLGEASGRALHFFTAVAVASRASGFEQCRVVEARVQFRELDPAKIEAYLAREPAYDCAGAAKVEGLGIALIASLECPDPTAIVGLPLIELSELLALAGRPVL